MTRRPLHGETGGTGIFDYHLDDGEVVEIDTVPGAGIAFLETGKFVSYRAGLGESLNQDERSHVHLDVRQLTELIGELTKARDFLREQLA